MVSEEKICQDYKAGAGTKKLAKKYGMSRARIKDILERHSVEMRQSKTWNVTPKKDVPETAATCPEEMDEPEEDNDQTEVDDGVTFYIYGSKKPNERCYPSEKDDLLAWAVDLKDLNDLIEFSEGTKGLVMIGDEMKLAGQLT